MKQSAEEFSRIISPMDTEEFFADYWEKKPLFISRENSGYYDRVLKPEDIQPYFHNEHISPGYVRVFKDNELSPKELWTTLTRNFENNFLERVIEPRKLLNLFNEGSTIIIQLCENVFPKLNRLRLRLENELKSFVQANIYITPKSSFCFDPHFDSHNVFIVQIHGSKKWNLYDFPFEFPIKTTSVESMGYRKRKPELTVDLKAGDLLYIPRGMVHNATAEDNSSIHITVSPMVRPRADLLKMLFEKVGTETEFRRLMPHRLSSEKEKIEFAAEITEQLQELIAQTDFPAMLHKHFIKRQRADIEGIFTDSLQMEELSTDSVVCRRPFLEYLIERTDEWTTIRFGDEEIVLPPFLETVLAKALQEEPFTVGEIEGIPNDAGKIALVKRFIRSGFLKIISL